MSERAVICNVGDQEWTLVRTYGVYRIPAPTKRETAATLEISDRKDVIDMGDNRRMDVSVPARRIAEDLAADLGDFGVFVAEGRTPSERELAAARMRLTEVAKRLVFEGDQEWARSHNYRMISDLHRRAVKQLGLEREWSYEPTQMQDCPVCGERVKVGVAVCKGCRAVLDAKKARAFGVAEKHSERRKKAARFARAKSGKAEGQIEMAAKTA